MKTISRIQAIGFKKTNFVHDLKPVSVLTGENASGKTAVVNAIQVGLLGFVPSLGKQPKATISLAHASVPAMEVCLEFSDGTSTGRNFKRTATGATVKETGATSNVSESQLDFSAFVSCKPTERHQILSSLMGDVDTKEIQVELTRKIAEMGLGSFKFALTAGDGNPITALVERVGEQGKFVKQSVDQGRKTLATLVAVEVPPMPDAAKLAAAKGDHETAIRKHGSAQQVSESLAARQGRQQAVEPEAAEPEDEVAEHATVRYDRCRTELTGLRAKLTEVSSAVFQAFRNTDDLRKRTEAVSTEPPTCEEPTDDQMAEAEMRSNELDEEIGCLDQDIELLKSEHKRLSESIDTIEKHGKCPCCGSEGDHLKVALDALTESRAGVGINWGTKKALRDDSFTAFGVVTKTITSMVAAHTAWEQYRKALVTLPTEEEGAAAVAAWHKAADEKAAVEKSISELEAEQADCQRITEAAAAWNRYRLATSNQPTEAECLAANTALNAAITARDDAKARLDALSEAQDTYNRAVADQQRISDLTKEADTNEATAKNLAELKKWLQAKEREATAKAMAPVLAISGVFLKDVVDGTLAIREHQLGIERDGQFLTLEILCGMETVAVAAALQTMMAAKSDVKIIMVDRMCEMQDDKAIHFLNNCQTAVNTGVIGQVILVDWKGSRYPAVLVTEIQP